jgi:hypothetical protein
MAVPFSSHRVEFSPMKKAAGPPRHAGTKQGAGSRAAREHYDSKFTAVRQGKNYVNLQENPSLQSPVRAFRIDAAAGILPIGNSYK